MAGPADILKNLLGTMSDLFAIGIAGPQLKKESGGELSIRNSDDTDYQILRAKTPSGDNDVVTKLYADTLEKPLIVSRQADTSVAIPNNTGTRGFVVVTTPGSGAVIGDLLYDDGSGSGQMSILAAVEGRTIAVTDALSGGSITFDPDSIYMWDADGSAWVKIGDIGSVTGACRVIRYNVTTVTPADSNADVPAGSTVLRCTVKVTTAYPGGATITVGDTVTADKFMDTTQNRPQVAGVYQVEQITDQAAASVVRTTLGGSPGSGACTVVVEHAKAEA